MTILYPGATWRPLPEATKQPTTQRKRLLIYHSIVGSAEAAFNYFATGTDLESHTIQPLYTPMWQIMDLAGRADANYLVNDIAISCETEDNGDPDHFPWTANQLHELIAFGVWCVKNPAFDIPAHRATSPFGDGIGYHSMWGAPSDWTPVVGKTCPGAVRIQQFNNVVLPGIIAGVKPVIPQEGNEMISSIDVMYDKFLGRPASGQELAGWYGAYSEARRNGMPQNEAEDLIVLGIYNSAEAKAHRGEV